jgi:hypothetical protein
MRSSEFVVGPAPRLVVRMWLSPHRVNVADYGRCRGKGLRLDRLSTVNPLRIAYAGPCSSRGRTYADAIFANGGVIHNLASPCCCAVPLRLAMNNYGTDISKRVSRVFFLLGEREPQSRNLELGLAAYSSLVTSRA